MKFIKTVFSRTTFMIIMVVAEFAFLYSIFTWFHEQADWINVVLRILSGIIFLFIIKNSRHLSMDMMWLVAIELFPIPATAAYIILGTNLVTSRTFREIITSTQNSGYYYEQDEEVLSELNASAPQDKGQFHYISREAGFPFYENKGFDYYRLGDDGFPVMLEELKKAEKFIFLEYFIIEEGRMWNQILAVLEEKASQGLDVRVMYDDVGSFFTLSAHYARHLSKKGIKCIPFNRINPIIGTVMNHRDHRKIMVIDGKVAFSGGVNLADEYINVKEKHGHWKDNVIRVKGEAVWSFTVMFLTHWNALSESKDEDFSVFRTIEHSEAKTDGYIAPYGETPLDTEIVAQNIYMGILNQANDYCYIMTPYLIIDSEFINALILAAKHGVDVRIITPGIPDNKIVWWITRSYYRSLVEGGVKIYEYTPGFVHSKVFVSDDVVATVGTVNLDYRSLYLHFENGTYLYGSRKVMDVKDDVLATIESCREIKVTDCYNGLVTELLLAMLRLIAPML